MFPRWSEKARRPPTRVMWQPKVSLASMEAGSRKDFVICLGLSISRKKRYHAMYR